MRHNDPVRYVGMNKEHDLRVGRIAELYENAHNLTRYKVTFYDGSYVWAYNWEIIHAMTFTLEFAEYSPFYSLAI